MKLRTLVFVAPALALLVGLGLVALAQGGDPLALFTDNVTATGPTTAVTGLEQELLDRLNGATTSIDVSIDSLNRLSIRDALIDAHNRGVTVRVVADDDAYGETDYNAHFQALEAAGISLVLDNLPSRMHNVFFVVDGLTVWTGSTSMTDNGFTYDHNNSLVFTSTQLADVYTTEFEEMFVGGDFGVHKSDNTTHTLTYAGTTLEVYFSPTDGAMNQLVDEVNAADESIIFSIHSFSDETLREAVITRAQAGVAVRGLLDKSYAGKQYSQDAALCAAGIPVKIEDFGGVLHNKFMVIDSGGTDPVVVSGSMDWTDGGATTDDENTLIIHDVNTAQAYLAAFHALYDALGDETLCQRQIFLPVVTINSSGVIEPPLPVPPVVLSLDGSSLEAGSDLRVRLEYHLPAERYDVYLYNPSLGYVVVCTGLMTDVFGSIPQATCHVPAATAPGNYQLVTIAAGGNTDPANHVAQGDLVEVLYPVVPVLVIQDSNRWPPGSAITFQLFGHNPCPPGQFPCPPYQGYDIALIGPGFPAPGTLITMVRVDVFGAASAGWRIPSWLAPDMYTVVTFEENTIDPVIASTVLDIVQAAIVVQGGNRWPAGATIQVHLRGHVPNRTYRLRWIDGGTGATTDVGSVTTDQFGNTLAPVAFRIPPGTADSPPAHRIVSFEEGGGGEIVAGVEVEVFTP